MGGSFLICSSGVSQTYIVTGWKKQFTRTQCMLDTYIFGRNNKYLIFYESRLYDCFSIKATMNIPVEDHVPRACMTLIKVLIKKIPTTITIMHSIMKWILKWNDNAEVSMAPCLEVLAAARIKVLPSAPRLQVFCAPLLQVLKDKFSNQNVQVSQPKWV